MPFFPTVEWFSAVREIVNEDPQFRSLGSCDCKAGVKVGDKTFLVTFEGFECADVDQIEEDGLRESDFFLDMPADDWKDLLNNIKANGGADSQHTLNTIDLTHPEGIVKSYDELRRVSFLQYHLSLQVFFDASAKVETTF